MLDGKAFGAEMTEIVKGYVNRATESLLQRIDALEKRQPEQGERGEPGESIKGETGVGVAGALIDRSGVLILTLSDGTQRDLGVVVGKDGLNGTSGADGLPGADGADGQDAPIPEQKPELSEDEKTALAGMFLQKELGTSPIIELPPIVFSAPQHSAPAPISLKVENHMPKRGVEKTIVTKHDERGRIVEFERHEV